jgi:hypothetical protein
MEKSSSSAAVAVANKERFAIKIQKNFVWFN